MKYISFLFTCFFLITSSLTANSANFISGFEDIPLMSGLKQIEKNDFSFSNEETHYIEAHLVATRASSFSQITNFYTKALAQLGWKENNSTSDSVSFYRENDVLEIVKTSTSPLKISIILKNRN